MVLKVLAKFKARQTRGGAWVQLFLNMGIITANVALFHTWFESYGLSVGLTIAIGILLYLTVTITLGFFDERHGIWQHENAYNSNLNPVMRKIQANLDLIIENQHEIRTELDKLEHGWMA